jgi:hypothetical protein
LPQHAATTLRCNCPEIVAGGSHSPCAKFFGCCCKKIALLCLYPCTGLGEDSIRQGSSGRCGWWTNRQPAPFACIWEFSNFHRFECWVGVSLCRATGCEQPAVKRGRLGCLWCVCLVAYLFALPSIASAVLIQALHCITSVTIAFYICAA